MRLRKLAAIIAVLVGAVLAAAGCSSAPSSNHTVGPTGHAAGYAGYWTSARMLAATPVRANLSHQPQGGLPAVSQPASVTPRVGALFFREPSGNHFCTASAVASPGRDLLITAAHCISGGKDGGFRKDIVFVPGYSGGRAPHGVWAVSKLLVAPGWTSASDHALDVGFVVLAPLDGRNIEDVLGANKLAVGTGYLHLVRVTGYPNSARNPSTCFTWTARQNASQQQLECAGPASSTSGSPWITQFDAHTRNGTIVGLTGGDQQVGRAVTISFSPYLGPAIGKLYRQAVAASSPSSGG
jgi:hypothetical protein